MAMASDQRPDKDMSDGLAGSMQSVPGQSVQKLGGNLMQLRQKLVSPLCFPSSTIRWVGAQRMLPSNGASMGPLRPGRRPPAPFTGGRLGQSISTAILVSPPQSSPVPLAPLASSVCASQGFPCELQGVWDSIKLEAKAILTENPSTVPWPRTDQVKTQNIVAKQPSTAASPPPQLPWTCLAKHVRDTYLIVSCNIRTSCDSIDWHGGAGKKPLLAGLTPTALCSQMRSVQIARTVDTVGTSGA